MNDNTVLDAGDELIFCFDRAVDAPGAPAVDVVLSGGAVLGAGATWSEGPGASCVTLTLGAGETVVSGLALGSSLVNVAPANTLTNPADGTVGATPLPAPGQSIMLTLAAPVPPQNIGAGNSTGIGNWSFNPATDLVPDVIVGKGPGPVEIYLATALGIFGAPVNAVGDPGTHYTSDIAVADVDGDSDLDYVTGNALGQPNFVYLNSGVGTGSFVHAPAPGQNELGTGNTTALVLIGLDDPAPDLIVVNGGTGAASTNWIYFDSSLNDGNFDGTGAFPGTNPVPFGGMADTVATAVGSVDAAGLPTDIVTIDAVGASGVINTYLLTPGAPPGGLAAPAVVTPGLLANPTACWLMNVNTGDPFRDLIVGYGNGGGFQVWLGDRTGGFTLVQTAPGGSVGALMDAVVNEDAAGDLFVGNTGGQPDKVWLNANNPGPAPGVYFVDSKVALGAASTFDLDRGQIDASTSPPDFVSASNTPNAIWLGGK